MENTLGFKTPAQRLNLYKAMLSNLDKEREREPNLNFGFCYLIGISLNRIKNKNSNSMSVNALEMSKLIELVAYKPDNKLFISEFWWESNLFEKRKHILTEIIQTMEGRNNFIKSTEAMISH